MTDTLTALEAEIIAAGHELYRHYGSVPSLSGPAPLQWIVEVDGETVATGESLGRVEGRLREWWDERRRS